MQSHYKKKHFFYQLLIWSKMTSQNEDKENMLVIIVLCIHNEFYVIKHTAYTYDVQSALLFRFASQVKNITGQ